MRDGTGTIKRSEGDVLRGLAAGLIGGLVASWTMNRFQDVWINLASSQSSGAEPQQQAEGQESG